MAAEPQKTAGEAAKEKVERREQAEEAVKHAEKAETEARKKDPRSPQEKRIGVEAGTVEPSGMTETGPDGSKSSEQLREEVEAAREELAETVTELGRKIDPRPQVEAATKTARSVALPVAGVAAILVLVLIWLKRR